MMMLNFFPFALKSTGLGSFFWIFCIYDNEKHAFSTGIFAIIEKETRLKSSSEAGKEEKEDTFSLSI